MQYADNRLFMRVLNSVDDQTLMHAPQLLFPARMRSKPVDVNESTPGARSSDSTNNKSGESAHL